MSINIKLTSMSVAENDYTSADGELAIAMNLTNDGDGLRAMKEPVVKFSLESGEQVLWVHDMTGHRHYIIRKDNSLYFVCENDKWQRNAIGEYTVNGDVVISSIGNTLLVNDADGVHYLLWKAENNGYLYLGQKPPFVEIQFGLHSEFAVYPDTKNTDTGYGDGYKGLKITCHDKIKNDNKIMPQLGNSDDGESWAYPRELMAQSSSSNKDKLREFAANYSDYSIEEIDGKNDTDKASLSAIKNTATQGVMAAVNKMVNEKGTKENKFVHPFFVRYAYKMYDGSYIMHSYPVLMIPNSRGPLFALDGSHGLYLRDLTDNYMAFKMHGRAYAFLSDMVMSILKVPEGLSNWKDIIVSIEIGVSAPVFTYDQSDYVYGWTNMDVENADRWQEYYTIGKVRKLGEYTVLQPEWSKKTTYKEIFKKLVDRSHTDYFCCYNGDKTNYYYPSYLATVKQKKSTDINEEIARAANFYIVKEILLEDITTCNEALVEMQDGTLLGLLGRRKLADDFRTHDIISAKLMYPYNSRVNYSDIKRKQHNPLNPAVQFIQVGNADHTTEEDSNNYRLQIAVTTSNNEQSITTESVIGYWRGDFPLFIFFPDSNAKVAYISKIGRTNVKQTYKLPLRQHDYLNGAYWLADIMSAVNLDALEKVPAGGFPIVGGSYNEESMIYTSEVNNPFVVNAEGINTIGTGKMRAIVSAAKALSQGQWGQFPLYAFTDSGVWALEVASNGIYRAKQAITRDVILPGTQPLQLDSEVAFVTNRGVMLLSGSTTHILSYAINSDTYFDVGSLNGIDAISNNIPNLIPFTKYLAGSEMMYDYSNQSIIVFNKEQKYAYVYNISGKVWSIIDSDYKYSLKTYPETIAIAGNDVVEVSSRNGKIMSAYFISRPIKFADADAMKTIRELIVRGNIDRYDVKIVLYGSRDLRVWHVVGSSVDNSIRGISGTPYKQFIIACACIIGEQERIPCIQVTAVKKSGNRIR